MSTLLQLPSSLLPKRYQLAPKKISVTVTFYYFFIMIK